MIGTKVQQHAAWVLVGAGLCVGGCSDSEQPEEVEQPLDLASIPVPPADGPPLVALRTGVMVRQSPSADGKPLGTLTVGARVARSEEAVTADGCAGGWYAVRPRGFVCAGSDATVDLESPSVAAVGLGPDLQRPMPFRYARVINGAAVTYGSVPTRAEMMNAEPKLGSTKTPAVRRIGTGSNDVPLTEERRPAGVPVLMPEAEGVGDDGYRTTETWFQFPSSVALSEGSTILDGDPTATQTRVLKRRSGLALLSTFTVGGESPRTFGIMPNGRFVPVDRLEPDVGTTWHGFHGAPVDLPAAFALRRGVKGWALEKTTKATPVDEELQPGQPVFLTGRFRTVNSTKFFETKDGFWARHRDLIIVYPRNKFPDWASGDQKWIDISLANQTLVAYEGRTPLLATLISSGREKLGDPQSEPSTMQGVFRLRKKSVTASVDDREVESAYSLNDVPWVLEFADGFSLTGCYWRGFFGEARSFHNVAMSAIDAHWLWHFTDPQLPEGWHSVNLDEDAADNTIVYVHK